MHIPAGTAHRRIVTELSEGEQVGVDKFCCQRRPPLLRKVHVHRQLEAGAVRVASATTLIKHKCEHVSLSECDDVTRRAHVSRKRELQGTVLRSHWGTKQSIQEKGERSNPSVSSSRFSVAKGDFKLAVLIRAPAAFAAATTPAAAVL